jgi:glycosyltransferase involved in cell wall biosynthesis
LFVATVASHIRAFHLPFIKMLQEQGHQVDVACYPDVPLSSPMPGVEMPVWEIPFARSPYHPGNIVAYLKIRRLLSERSYDLVHVNTPAAAFLTRLAARNMTVRGVNMPVLYMAHGFHFYQGAPLLYRLLYYSMERLASRWTAGLIVLNREDLLAARGFGLVEGENLWLVHGVGVDLDVYGHAEADRLADTRKLLGLAEDAPVVICIAELIPRKNHRQLFEAWTDVHSRLTDAALLVVGTGELEQELRRAAESRRFGGSIRMLGYRIDIPDLLELSDMIVLTSRHEGLPRVVMEAMAAARPVVATDVRGSRDLVRDGESGLLVPLGRPALLADALLRLLGYRALARRMGAAGREMIQEYALDRVLREMDAVYSRFFYSL